MGALDLVDALRTLGVEVKTLFTSKNPNDAVVHYGILGAGLPFLEKPWNAESLPQKVREVLGAAASPAIETSASTPAGPRPS